jgi:hypothetical protein
MTDNEIASFLQLFDRDPRAALNQQPTKEVVQDPGRGIATLFPQSSIQGNAFVAQRDQYRRKMRGERSGVLVCLDQILPGRAPFQENDLVEDVVDVPATQIVRTLEGLEQKKLLAAKLSTSPWSSTYWPIYQGQLGARYADPQFPGSEDWQENRAYIEKKPASDIAGAGNRAALDNLSPAEKYDLLVGDSSFALTEANWRDGRQYYESSNPHVVETWMGICHGWSPAAYMMPRPVKIVTLVAADGRTKLTFFPADIKALGCLLWAKTNPTTRFIGGRCDDKDPATDENGRVISQDSFDTNPGTWHLAVTNQLGIARRSMVIDASYDYEVWNQPLVSYNYGYFNPVTRKLVTSLRDARVSRAAFTNDKFAKYRSPSAQAMVGISMNLVYVAETMPTHATTDSAKQDRLVTVSYFYDVELDGHGNILGGEWYVNKHPDFLWTPPAGAQAISNGDDAAGGGWDTHGPVPQSWRDAAVAASCDGQPLAKIVNALFTLAK